MKNLFVVLLCVVCLRVVGQSTVAKQPATPSPFRFVTLEGWREEKFPILIDFAPQIPYKGIEVVRFAPGWSEKQSPQYWSYIFLWWLEGSPQLDAGRLEKDLTAYYAGLVGRNITRRNIPPSKVVATKVAINQEDATLTNQEVYRGTISMLDYMAQNPITLNCLIQVTPCQTQDRVAVIVQISPQPPQATIWKDLATIQQSFDCPK